MRIILTENDIKKALIAYTSTLGLDLANHHVAIELTAGRGANGHSATVIIDEADADTEQTAPIKSIEGSTPKRIKEVVAKETVDITDDDEVDLPAPTPETPVQGVNPNSLFGD